MCHHGNLKYVQEGFSGSTKNYFHHVFFNKRRGVSCEFSDVMFCINNSCIFACCWEKKEIACSANTPSCSFLLLPFILSQFLGGFRSTLSQPGPFQFLPSFLPSFLSLPRPPHLLLSSSSLPVLWKFRVQTFTHSACRSACLKPTEHLWKSPFKLLLHWISK